MVLLTIMCCLGLAGCWDRREINDLAMVTAVAADEVEDKGDRIKEFTLQIANPVALVPGQGGGGPGGPKSFWTVAGRGRNNREAMMDIAKRIPKSLFYGQTRSYIIGEEAARNGIAPYLDNAVRFRESRGNIFLVIAKGQAKKVLEVDIPTLRGTGLALSSMFELNKGETGVISVTLNDFCYALTTGSTSPVAPVVEVVPQSSVTSEDLKSEGGPSKTIKISGMAVFDTKGHLVGFLNEEETLGLMWVKGKTRHRSLIIPCPVVGAKEPIALDVMAARSDILVDVEEGMPKFKIRIEAFVDLAEHFGSHKGFMQPEVVKKIEDRCSEQIKREGKRMLKKARELNADVLGLGEKVHRYHPREWQRIRGYWPHIFPDVQVEWQVKTKFRHRGLMVEPLGSRGELDT